MEYVEPIKEIDKIITIKKILKNKSKRDYLFFVLGINTGIRVSDLLNLTLKDVWAGGEPKEFLTITDEKKHEEKLHYLNSQVNEALKLYIHSININEDDYLFKSTRKNLPITRQQAYRIINQAAKEAGIRGNIGTHTLRKTFGYHAYRKGIAISLLKSIYNHTTPAETLRYIGIDKKKDDVIIIDVNL